MKVKRDSPDVQSVTDLLCRFGDLPARRTKVSIELRFRQTFVCPAVDSLLLTVKISAGIAFDDFNVSHDQLLGSVGNVLAETSAGTQGLDGDTVARFGNVVAIADPVG